MDNINIFVKTIIILSFMWCIAETVLPESSVQKYSSFIYGLVIISLLISTFAKIGFEDFELYSQNVETSEINSNYIKTLYEEKVGDALIDKFGNKSIRVELSDDYKIKKIYCDDKKTYDDIMRYLNE